MLSHWFLKIFLLLPILLLCFFLYNYWINIIIFFLCWSLVIWLLEWHLGTSNFRINIINFFKLILNYFILNTLCFIKYQLRILQKFKSIKYQIFIYIKLLLSHMLFYVVIINLPYFLSKSFLLHLYLSFSLYKKKSTRQS